MPRVEDQRIANSRQPSQGIAKWRRSAQSNTECVQSDDRANVLVMRSESFANANAP